MASHRATSSRVSTLGRKSPARPATPITASRSASARPVSSPFTRTQTRLSEIFPRVGAHAGARIRLLRRRHGILEIEDEGIRRQPDGLLQELFAIGRNVEKAARKRHGPDPSRARHCRGSIRQSIHFRKKMDARVRPAHAGRRVHSPRPASHPPRRGRGSPPANSPALSALVPSARRAWASAGRSPVRRDRAGPGLRVVRICAEPRMLDLLHHAPRDDLRVVEHLLEIVHARARHAGHASVPASRSSELRMRTAGSTSGSSASSLILRLA